MLKPSAKSEYLIKVQMMAHTFTMQYLMQSQCHISFRMTMKREMYEHKPT